MLEISPGRLTFPEYILGLALMASGRATCPRARVGCVLLSSDHRIAATGYNGVPSGQPHCDDVGCIMENGHCSKTVHAEKSASLTLGERKLPNGFAGVTIRPCQPCFDILAATEITNIFYLKEYNNKDDREHIEKVCLEKRMIFKHLPYDPAKLLQKLLDFHMGQGGLFVGQMPFEINQKEKEETD